MRAVYIYQEFYYVYLYDYKMNVDKNFNDHTHRQIVPQNPYCSVLFHMAY